MSIVTTRRFSLCAKTDFVSLAPLTSSAFLRKLYIQSNIETYINLVIIVFRQIGLSGLKVSTILLLVSYDFEGFSFIFSWAKMFFKK